MCANHGVAYRKALAWLGHSNSEMLDLYYHLHDDDSQKTLMELAKSGAVELTDDDFEDSLRTVAGSKIVKNPQVPELQELMSVILKNKKRPERAGFYLPSLCNILNNLILQLNSNNSKDLDSLVDLLFSHDFLLSRDAF